MATVKCATGIQQETTCRERAPYADERSAGVIIIPVKSHYQRGLTSPRFNLMKEQECDSGAGEFCVVSLEYEYVHRYSCMYCALKYLTISESIDSTPVFLLLFVL